MITTGNRGGGGKEERDGRKDGLPEWTRWCEVWFDTARRRRRTGSQRPGVGIRGSGVGEISLRRAQDRPPSASSGQALREVQGRFSGDGWTPGMCSVDWGNVFSFLPNVFSFGAKVFTFRPNVFTLAGEVFSEEEERSEGREVRREKRGGWAGDGCVVGVWFDGLTRGARCAGVDHGAGSRLRTPGWRRDGEMCPLGQADVSSFGPDVSTFRPNVSSFGGNVSSFRRHVSSS